jgi:hypothetical protein
VVLAPDGEAQRAEQDQASDGQGETQHEQRGEHLGSPPGRGGGEQQRESKDSGRPAGEPGGAAAVAGGALVVASPGDPGEALAAVAVWFVVAGTARAGVPPGGD